MTQETPTYTELDLADQREKVVEAAKLWYRYMTNLSTQAQAINAHQLLIGAIAKLEKAEKA